MQNTFEQIQATLHSLENILSSNPLPQIEKDIVLEKIRKLYLLLIDNAPTTSTETLHSDDQKYERHQGLTEDVDLFFDTQHESYNSSLQEDDHNEILKAEEARQQQRALEQQRLAEEERRKAEEARQQQRALEQQRLAEEERRKAEEARQQPHDEDDLLQFIPKTGSPTSAPKTEPLLNKVTTQRSLNDLFNEQREDKSLSAQFQRAKITDLTKAISINDKFTYIRELFNNKGEEFSAAIQQLNMCQNMDAAFDCLENLKQKFFWDSTSTAYLSLCDLLRRKFN